MRLRAILLDAFEMLRERPVLFLPRIVTSLVWSGFWIWLVGEIQGSMPPPPSTLPRVALFLAVMTPIQVWVYNAYFIVVEQYRDGPLSIGDALVEGFRRLPQGIAALIIPAFIVGIGSVPGVYLALQGVVTGDVFLQLIGGGLILAVIVLGGVYFYFTPVAVVLGGESFRTNFLEGLDASRENRRVVAGITVLSILVLGLTTVLEGGARTVGIVGFVVGRMMHAIISVYILVVNPDLYLSVGDTES